MTTISILQNKQNKRKRTVKNALINFDNISIEPGACYINWRNAAKSRLIERENKLMDIRLDICEKSIVSSMQQFTTENSTVFGQHIPAVHITVGRMEQENYVAYCNIKDTTRFTIKKSFNKSITQQLSIWNGYKPNSFETENNINTFKDYFSGSRRWWDICKQKMIAKDIFILITNMIDKVMFQIYFK